MALEGGTRTGAEEQFDAAAAVSSLQFKMSQVQENAMLGDIRETLAGLGTTVADLSLTVQKLRGRGYGYNRYWEDRIQSLTAQWQELRPKVERELERQRKTLQLDADAVARRVNRLTDRSSETQVKAVEDDVEALDSKVDATARTLREMYDSFAREVNELERETQKIERLYQRIDTSTFQLQPGEAPVGMVKGKLMRDEKEGYEGFLFLTNQRVIFEQEEEIVKKKMLFIATEKEKVQKVLLDEPVGRIESVEESEKGGFIGIGKKELLELFFDSSASRPRVLFQLKEDSEKWRGIFRRVISGDLDRELVEGTAEALAVETARLADVPTECPNCGAPLDQTIPRGAQSISCEYCGKTIRIG